MAAGRPDPAQLGAAATLAAVEAAVLLASPAPHLNTWQSAGGTNGLLYNALVAALVGSPQGGVVTVPAATRGKSVSVAVLAARLLKTPAAAPEPALVLVAATAAAARSLIERVAARLGVTAWQDTSIAVCTWWRLTYDGRACIAIAADGEHVAPQLAAMAALGASSTRAALVDCVAPDSTVVAWVRAVCRRVVVLEAG